MTSKHAQRQKDGHGRCPAWRGPIEQPVHRQDDPGQPGDRADNRRQFRPGYEKRAESEADAGQRGARNTDAKPAAKEKCPDCGQE